ncbi:hypothetical protein Ga0102493_11791 [Erythrobacter litoralis]|jgi:hypothetical protein|uniref:hypothetical protein n=1 Tax=Erythrobacter TaxID=1041 RepID=UPI000863C56D|nr:hypothetical protein [Erythrobacter litoralis]AOL24920.1 hypothetical protein Ga0102493_11791 [Erythrobacter litoralis]MEE4338795.1 hypothetical protein [Erythrobacter sp.]
MNELTTDLARASEPDDVDRKALPSLERRRLRAYIVLLLLDGLLIQMGFSFGGLISGAG